MKYIHSLSDVQSDNIGEETRIWQYCIVLPKAMIGNNCNICAYCYVENHVVIGNNVTIKNGVYIWDGIVIEDDVQIGPNVTFTNDKYPRAKQPFKLQKTLIQKKASIGAGTVILVGVTIGENAMIGVGSVGTKNVPANELWFGNPAKFIRKID